MSTTAAAIRALVAAAGGDTYAVKVAVAAARRPGERWAVTAERCAREAGLDVAAFELPANPRERGFTSSQK